MTEPELFEDETAGNIDLWSEYQLCTSMIHQMDGDRQTRNKKKRRERYRIDPRRLKGIELKPVGTEIPEHVKQLRERSNTGFLPEGIENPVVNYGGWTKTRGKA